MSPFLNDRLDRCLEAVSLHDHHDLEWLNRVSFWKALNNELGSKAIVKRALMSYIVTRELMPIWRSCDIAPDARGVPEIFLQFAAGILRNEVPALSAVQFLDEQQNAVERARFAARACGYASLIPAAAIRTCWDALEEDLDREIWPVVESGAIDDRSAEESDHEVHFLASIVYSGGLPGASPESDDRRFEFWKAWLTEKLPFVIVNSTERML